MSIVFPIVFGRRIRLALLVVAIVGLTSFVIGARARLTNHILGKASGPAQNTPASTAPSMPSATRITSHILTLGPRGFDPPEVSWPKGKFLLIIDNRSNVSDLTMRLDREAGGRVKEIKFKMRKERSAGVVDLIPGNYLLTEANHPGWICRMSITPQ